YLRDELLDDLTVSSANRFWIGDHFEIFLFQVFEEDVAVERQVELGLIEEMKYDHVIALEAKQPQPFQNLLRFVEQIGNQNHQSAPLDLTGDVLEDSADVRVAARTALLKRIDDLDHVVALGARRQERFDPIGKRDDAGGVLLLQNKVGERCGKRAAVVELGDTVRRIVHRRAGIEHEIGA